MISWDLESNGRALSDPAFKIHMVCLYDGVKAKVWDRKTVPAAISLLPKLGPLVGHNATFYDRVAVKRAYGPNLKTGDTMIMAYLHDEEAGQRGTGGLKLENLAIKYLGVPEWKDAVSWSWSELDEWSDEDPRWDTLRTYCTRDTIYTRQLAEVLAVRLREEGLWDVYESLLLPASRALANLEETGVHVSIPNLEYAQQEFEREKDEAEKYLKAAGLDKPGSTKSLAHFLFTTHHLTPTHFTPTGAPATHELALKTLKKNGNAAVVDALLKYRSAAKSLSTYIKPYTELQKVSHDARVHPSYSLTYTVTGRTSSFSPNIQNIPRDPRVRSIIGAPDGHVLLQADLSQAELRVAAFLAREENMLRAFRNGDDLHYLMAERITGKPRNQITKSERTNAKIANFAYLYGAETATFLDQAFKDYDLVFSYEEADAMRNAFFASWPGLWPWYTSVHQELTAKQYVTSKTGRRRRFPYYNVTSDYLKTDQLRQAINFTVQSLASDIALCALVLVTGMGYKTTAYIHDAIQVEVECGKVDEAAAQIKDGIENMVPKLMEEKFGIVLDVPIVSDIEAGYSWGSLEKIL